MRTRLKVLRENSRKTQAEIANVINCSPGAYAKYERGEREPDIDTLKRMSKCFDTPIDYIVYNDRIENFEV